MWLSIVVIIHTFVSHPPLIYPITHPLTTYPLLYIVLFEKVDGYPLRLYILFSLTHPVTHRIIHLIITHPSSHIVLFEKVGGYYFELFRRVLVTVTSNPPSLSSYPFFSPPLHLSFHPPLPFLQLFRRVLVTVTRNPPLSILCTRSLIRLYSVCHDIIGGFDDMLLIVKLLDEALNMELQHCLIDLLELLSSDHSNLLQLLDKSFVDSIIK